jgi:chromosome transmission fidelity protein 8
MDNSHIEIHPPSPERQPQGPNPLPPLIQTPSGLALLELHGSFKISDAAAAEAGGSGVRIGKIDFPLYNPESAEDEAWMKKVYMYVDRGSRLKGEVKKLPKAFAIVRKRDGPSGGSGEELEVAEVVKYKIYFSERPEPIGSRE